MRRLLENVVVAVAASAVTWALSNPGASGRGIRAATESCLDAVARYGGPFAGWLWSAAIALVVIGGLLQVLSMAPRHPRAPWDLSVSLPSAPMTFMGVGMALGVMGQAVGLAKSESLWAVPLLVLTIYWAWHWLVGVRYRWSRMSQAL